MQQLSPTRKWATLVVLSLALAIIIIDTTILNVSLGTIIKEFNTDIQSIQWVITAYSLALAALTITGGRLGDLFGRKKMFVLGAVVFAIGSFITSISHNIPTMIWGESIIEGVGAAMMMPATASLLVSTFKGRERALAFGVWGGIAAASAAIGPIVGGYLTSNYSWRWAFRINVFVALVLVIGSFIIREFRDTEEKPKLDFIGVILSSLGMLSLVFGIIEASKYGWWFAKEQFITLGHTFNFGSYSVVPISMALGVTILTLFMLWERFVQKQGNTPLVSLKLFSNRQYASGVFTTMLLSLSQAGLIFALPVFLQAVRSLDAYHTGLSLLPLSLTALIAAPLAAVVSHKIKPKYLIQTGLIAQGASFWFLREGISTTSTTASIAPGLILFGLGMGFVMSQITNMTMSAVSVQEAGEASGVNNTFRQLGQTLGSAILGSILLTALAANLTSGVNASNVIPEQAKPQINQAIAGQSSSFEFGGSTAIGENVPPQIAEEIKSISQQATVDANKRSLGFGVLFALLALLASIALPSSSQLEREESAASGH